MKRFFRCCTVVLGAGIALILLAGVVLYFSGVKKLTKSYPNIPVEKVNVLTDADAIARGEHIAIIWGCTKCHGDDLSGTLIDNSAFSGRIAGPNLTSGNGGIASSYADTDWIRAVRHGVKSNGQVEVLMYDYSKMSDQDLGDLLAYLKQLPPVDSNQPPMRLGVMLPIGSALGIDVPAAERIDHNAPHLVSTVPSATIEYGKYLSAVCTECHQAKNIGKAVDDWGQEEFIHAFQTGTRSNGEQISRAMRTKTFSALNETELSALWLYFRSLQPAESQK